MDTSQYMSMFLEESMDNLQTLNDSLLQLEQEPNDIDKLNEIFRVAHTIKGMAATMGFNQMAELTHKMEDVLSEFRDGQLKVTEKVVTVLFKCLDTLEQMVNNISDGVEDETPIDEIIRELESITDRKAEEPQSNEEVQEKEIDATPVELNEYDINVVKQAEDRGFHSYQIKIMLSENTLLKSARAFLIFKSLEELGEIIKSIPSAEDIENENFDFEIDLIFLSTKGKGEIYESLMNISEVEKVLVDTVDVKAEKAKKIEQEQTKVEEIKTKIEPKPVVTTPQNKNNTAKLAQKEAHKKTHQSVRVDLERLDKFMNMVSELVIHRTRLEQISSNHRLTDLNETLEQVARTTSDLQDLVMKIRMLPLDTVFNRFPRMIRDLSVELEKEMELLIQGADTELDRTVIDEIGEPLTPHQL